MADNLIKKALIDYIYKTIQLSKYKLKPIENEDDLKIMKEREHYVAPHYMGYNYLLVFIRHNFTNHSYFVNRRDLKFKKEHVHLEEIELKDTTLTAHVDIYDGTIIDGLFLNKNSFLITDSFSLAGESLCGEDMKNKLLKVSQYFDSFVDCKYSDIEFHFNKLYKYYDMKNLVYNVMTKEEWNTKGVIFYPVKSGIKLFFYFTMESIKNTKYAIFEVRKTEIPDVYDLYLYDKKSVLKKFGIAYVPSQQISHHCKKIFEAEQKKNINMKCRYSLEHNKWIPEEIAKKKPDTQDTINKITGIKVI